MGRNVHATIRIRAIDEEVLDQLLSMLEMDSKRIIVDTFYTDEITLPGTNTPAETQASYNALTRGRSRKRPLTRA